MVVCYKTSKFNYFLFKRLISLENISLPNILMNSDIVPELIQDNLTAQSVATQLMLWTIDSQRIISLRQAGSNFLKVLDCNSSQYVNDYFDSLMNQLIEKKWVKS